MRDHQDFLGGVLAQGGGRFNLNAGGEAAARQRHLRQRPILRRARRRAAHRPHLHRRRRPARRREPWTGRGAELRLLAARVRRPTPMCSARRSRWMDIPSPSSACLRRTSIGVEVGRTFDVAVPLGDRSQSFAAPRASLDRRSSWWLRIFGRLTPGQTFEQVNARLAAFHPGLREATMPQDWRPQDQGALHRAARSRRPPATRASLDSASVTASRSSCSSPSSRSCC